MRALSCIALYCLGVQALNKTLQEVYGTVDPVTQVLPWHQRSKDRAARRDTYFQRRSPEDCTFPLEVVILQDATASFQDDFDQMKNVQIPKMIETLLSSHPDSKFAMVSFRDKPIWSLGEPKTDYCVKFEQSLTADVASVQNVYGVLESLGGGDPSENQFGTLVAASQSQTPGWANPDAARLIVVATDAPPHFEGDGLNAYGMQTFSGTFDEARNAEQCLEQYYPTPDQVKSALLGREAYAAFVVYDGDYWNELPRDSWSWFNTYIGQDSSFVNPLAEDSSNFWDLLSQTISRIEDIECGTVTTLPPVAETTTPAVTISAVGSTEAPPVTQAPPLTTVPECPPCEEDPCPPCEGPCCDEVEIKLRHKPKELHLDVVN